MTSKKPYVSASDVSETFFCAYRVRNRIDGKRVSFESKAASLRGDAMHERQNSVGVDRRCYISTYIYGANDPRTIALRRFRDQVLMPTVIGRGLVYTYYLLSPHLIRVCMKYSWLDKRVKSLVRCITQFLS